MTQTLDPIPVSHIVWDWNGTLINDTHLCASVVSEVLAEWSLPPIQAVDYRRMFRFPVRDFYDDLGFGGGHEDWLRVCDSFIEKYRNQRHSCSLHDGVTDLLHQFAKSGIHQIILSASMHEHLREDVLHHGIDHHFYAILGQDNIRAEGKIHRGRQWFGEQKVDPNHVVLIGDTNHDYEVAQELGIHCLLHTNGHQDEERLAEFPAKKFDSLFELTNLIIPL
jgi:phosphoglycolate phosphatase